LIFPLEVVPSLVDVSVGSFEILPAVTVISLEDKVSVEGRKLNVVEEELDLGQDTDKSLREFHSDVAV